jgi:hypothetical protein
MTTHLLTQRAYQRRRKAALIAKGLCPWCGKSEPAQGRTRCEPCIEIGRASARAYMARRRPAWKALGICVHCGQRQAVQSTVLCGACAEACAERKARRTA